MTNSDLPVEIERRFLVINDDWKQDIIKSGAHQQMFATIKQGYLSTDPAHVVRVRLYEEGDAHIVIKGKNEGATRVEFQYEIPETHAQALLQLCDNQLVTKRRYMVEAGPDWLHLWWDVDVFTGANEGLVIAEIELHRETDQFDIPSWLGVEVTNDYHYSNVQLAKYPFSTWKNK
jgi:adenylate cyclase